MQVFKFLDLKTQRRNLLSPYMANRVKALKHLCLCDAFIFKESPQMKVILKESPQYGKFIFEGNSFPLDVIIVIQATT